MKRLLVILLLVVVLPIAIYKLLGLNSKPHHPVDSNVQQQSAEIKLTPDRLVAGLVQNERLIRSLGPQYSDLNRLILNLDLQPDNDTGLFSHNCFVRDVTSCSAPLVDASSGVQNVELALGDAVDYWQTPSVWSALFEKIDYFENAKLYAVRVDDRSFLPKSFSTKTAFDALARTKSGGWWAIQATGRIQWQRSADDWQIGNLEFTEFNIRQTSQLLFEEVTAKCLSAEDCSLVQRSAHFEKILKLLDEGPSAYDDVRQQKYFPHIATGRHPSLSIVDIDQDGWDDLYVVEQWRKNLLFRNNGNGTFTESAEKFGLDIDGYGTSATFADFDNDGDQDLFLGRSLRRSQFHENIDGRFSERSSDWFDFDLPFLASTVSAADYNNDGLLDLYVGTYGFLAGGSRPIEWIREFVEPQQRKHVLSLFRSPDFNRYTNAAGPGNYLLENLGGRFQVSRFNENVATFKNTLQATWSDYDSDGDQDLYVANDFARDYLYRNDRDAGFKDVTLEFGDETMMGFGMGASWGDYDLDGKQDLYVSNMYSKAGIRIVEHFGDLDQKFRRSADGNRLYRNQGDGLKLASANEGEGASVHKAGWSWGGQFVDLDNNGYLDIYVTAGYFTAPDLYDTDKDL